MATVKQYTLNLWRAHKTVCQKLGMDVTYGDPQERVRVISWDVMLAGLVKVLTDKVLVTDAELTAVFNAITSASFPPLPLVSPPDFDQTVPDPDLGA